VQILWTEAASSDLDSIAAYINKDRPGASVRLVLLIIDHVEKIVPANPAAGRPGRVPGTRELVIAGIDYIIAYRVRHKCIEILCVLHGAGKCQLQPARYGCMDLVKTM